MPSLTPRISPPSPEHQADALRLLLGDAGSSAAAEQVAAILAAEREGLLSLAGLIAAYQVERLVGAAWGLVQPGRTALVWPPRLLAGEPDSTADALLTEVLSYLRGTDICLAQAALAGTATNDAERLSAQGFTHAADLLYLACDERSFPASCPHSEIELEGVTPENEERLVRIVDRTYYETQDCPELNGVRDTRDVLEGYRHTGVFAPERWLIARAGQVDLGCLLLADHPAEEQWELVYMGVTPEARGRRLGLTLTRQAQWLTRAAGRKRLVLAVDARNEPALAVYTAAGFEAFDRRSVFLCRIPSGE